MPTKSTSISQRQRDRQNHLDKITGENRRRTQRGVAKAAATRKRTNENAAKVRNIETSRKAAQKQVEQTITAAKKAAAKSTSETIRPQDEKRSAKQLAETLRGDAQQSTMKITAAAEKLEAAERQLKLDKIDARGASSKDSPKAHRDRDAAILELIKLGAGFTYIARVRSVPSSTNRGLCRVLQGGRRI